MSGFESLSGLKFLMIPLISVINSNYSHGTVGRTAGSWSASYGFDSQPLPAFFNFINTSENRDIPFHMHKNFRLQKFSQTQKGSSTKWFGTVRQNIFHKKSWYPPLIDNSFRYDFFWSTKRFPSKKFFGTVRQKSVDGKLWYLLFCINYRNQCWNWCLWKTLEN